MRPPINASPTTRCLVGVLSLMLLSSCTWMKADEAQDAGFLEQPERMKEDRARFPFNKVWLKDYSEGFFDQYKSIVIAPVNTEHLLKQDWMDKVSLESQIGLKKDVREIADYLQNRFREEIGKDKEARFQLVESKDSKTLVLEIALVELVPTKAWLNATGQVAGFFVPGAATAAGLAASGSVAIEGRIKDGETGEILLMFKDRESDQLAPIGIQDYTWYKHAEDEIDDWADQWVEILDTKADHKVADSAPLTFRVW